jgi:hypothetical protein
MSDPMVIRRIPLVGSVGASRSDEWVDASQLALQQDQVRVQVTQVAIGPIESASNSKKKENQKNYLQIRLRTYRVQDSNAFVANRFESPYPRADKPRPTVTDRSGMVHQPLNLLSAESAEQYRRSTVFPVSIVDDVFIFDAFPLDDADVRLEIPTAAWGGVGAFRFRIPNAMIRRNATPQVGSVGGARER